MPAAQGNTRVVGNRCYTLISIPVSVLTGFDDDGNGLLSPAELGAHSPDIERQLDQRVRFFDDTVPGKTIYQTLLVEHTDSATTNMSSITLMRISEFPKAVKRLRVKLDLFAAASADTSLTFNAIHDKHSETQRFSAARTEHVFFRSEGLGPWIFGALTLLGVALLAARRRPGVSFSL